MKKWLLFSCSYALAFTASAQKTLIGFTASNSEKQVEWEKTFDAQIQAEDLDAWMKFLTAHPHHVGSPQGKANATYMVNLFQQWGYQAELATYSVLFPTPKTRVLELLGDKPYKAKLEEPAIPGDPYTAQKSEQLPTYNAFSADGDVTAPLVFVNRGVPDDYDELAKRGIDVKGKIVIAKYGGSWRGIKPKVAYEHGAIGCIIYSDPADDGYVQGDVYPKGAFRPKDGAQRGSVMDMPVYPGDPLTPGVGSTPTAKRLDRSEVKTIMKIPVLPISYEDALPLLQSLEGDVVPAAWRGGLPLTYHLGPSKAPVHLKLQFNWDLKPLYNVVAKLPGTEMPNEWVIRGNHHDAWVNGAEDPVSGLVAEMAEAKALGELYKKGYRPKRTIVYCAWDGEEPALLGSTEWAEDHQAELQQKAVAYINSDGNGRGFIGASGSHTLEPFFNQVLDDVVDPQTGVSVKERRYAKDIVAANRDARQKMFGNKTIKLGALGAGSDYSPFIQHLGIASMNLGFGGEDEAGVYHSIYDNYTHYTRFGDPGFQYGVALAKTAGRVTLRLANADVLPFDFSAFYKTVADYTAEVKKLLDDKRTDVQLKKDLAEKKLFVLASDPQKKYTETANDSLPPYLNFSPLDNSLLQLKENTVAFAALYGNATQLPAETQKTLNDLLFKAERSLTTTKGLPRRPWYRHTIYAPGFYTGYGVKTLPQIREGIEQGAYGEAQDGIDTVAKALEAYNAYLTKAILLLRKSS
ncbi:transferrin receptor-like dimerization domain-containing protein [Flavisolibacter nicotianae]|uniref:transferrin receptor-like dimerization domain-containing protein n=1 Tax=Flavisolibacter nicotianae TaxID=2364882 RepID=UPI000EB5D565|nr:transferrin receptor-like dimerization domain-containing protein [Flavisolibacter nicotianae]